MDTLVDYRAIFATEQAAVHLCDAGIALDTVISDFDSVANQTSVLEKLRTCATVEVLPKEKDMTDTKAMFDFIAKKYPGVAIDLFNTFEGRTDHSLALLSLFYQTHNPLTIITKQTRMTLLQAGDHLFPRIVGYKYLSLVVLEAVENLVLRDMQYETTQEQLPIFSDLMISNAFGTKDFGKVSFSKGSLLLIYSKDS